MWIAALLLLAGALPAAAQSTVGPLSVRVETPFQTLPMQGNLPARITLRNSGSGTETVEMTASLSVFGQQRITAERRVSFTVPPLSERQLYDSVPIGLIPQSWEAGVYSVQLKLEFSSRFGLLDEVQLSNLRDHTKLQLPPVALSAALRANEGLYKVEAESRSRSFSGVFVKPADFPLRWQDLGGLDRIWLTSRDLSELHAEQRGALRDWLILGGRLEVLPSNSESLAQALQPYAMIREHVNTYRIGLGSLTVLPATATGPSPAEVVREDSESFLYSWLHRYRRPFSFELRSDSEFKRYAVVALLVIYGLLVGPLNLYMFSTVQTRYRLYITTPLFALGTSTLLLLIAFFGDGLFALGTRRATVVLDSFHSRAAVLQEQEVRTGLLLSSEFSFHPDSALRLLDSRAIGDDNDGGRIMNGYSFREAPPGTLSGDWFRSRSVQAHAIERIVPYRGTVTVEPRPEGGFLVHSTLRGLVRELLFFSRDGGIWTTNELRSGGRAALTRLPRTTKPHWVQELREVHEALAPSGVNFFVARVEGDDTFFEETLPVVNWQDSRVVILGRATPKLPGEESGA